jgi:ubiquinone biosynthesis accessory factor UbiJ
MIIKPILIGVLESALNRYLAMDEDAEFFLQPLSGKVIAVTIMPFETTVYCCPAGDKIQLLEAFHGDVDASITGSAVTLGLMSVNASVSSEQPEMEGDQEIGHTFLQLFGKLDVDLEEQLSNYTGDIIAHKIGNWFRSGREWTQQSLVTFRLNTEEFLQEETRELPAKAEADIFFADVDKLAADVQRVERLIEKLNRKTDSSPKEPAG